MCVHRKDFNTRERFGICSDHFSEDCFARSLHVKGSLRRLQQGSLPSIWKKENTTTEVSASARSRRQVSFVFIILQILPMSFSVI